MYYRSCPPPKLTQPSGAVHSIWWLGFFFFDLFSYSGLRAFFTSDFTNCTTDYVPPKLTQPSGAVHSIWWLGFFFDFFSYSGLRAFFHKWFYELYYQIMSPPKLPQPSGAVHSIWWLGFFFFLTSSPILDLEHFSQVILRIVLQIMPPPNYPNHQVLFRASDGWVFFFDLFSYSGLRAFFTSYFMNCTTDYAPPN